MNIKHLFKKILLINFFIQLSYKYNVLMLFGLEKEDMSSFKDNNSLLRKINKYIMICKQGILIHPFKYNLPESIKITALIPVFNSSNSIKSTIISIQNQNMKDIEILLVDDNSLDNTIEIIENLQKQDKRIKILKNKFNKGILYSRSIGALNSNGKFIMTIDNDDLFLNNIFQICYNESITNEIDILEFSGFESQSAKLNLESFHFIPYYLQNKINNLIIFQPELSTFMYKKRNQKYFLIDAYIWGKIINSFIYKKAIKLVGNDMLNSNISWSEDRIVNFALFQVAKSFKFINIRGIFHYLHPLSVGHRWKKINKEKISHDEIMYVKSLYNLTKYSSKIDIPAYELLIKRDLILPGLTNRNKILIKNLFINFISSKLVSKFRKKKIISIYKSKLFKQ